VWGVVILMIRVQNPLFGGDKFSFLVEAPVAYTQDNVIHDRWVSEKTDMIHDRWASEVTKIARLIRFPDYWVLNI
jgi:hypothetical protein